MATFTNFEEIEAWQKARVLSLEIYKITSGSLFSKDFELRNQIRRAVISAMSNIAEGFERSGTKEFSQFLAIAKGSVGEVRSQLYLALDLGYLDVNKFNELSDLAVEVAKILAGLIRYLGNSKFSGTKFKRITLET